MLITCGAYEALYSAVAGLIEPGDEVIIIEPYYDCYASLVRIFEGVPRFVALKNVRKLKHFAISQSFFYHLIFCQ